MTEADLAAMMRHCPVLYHMAAGGAWPGIGRHGLLSTAALLDLYGVAGERRDTILTGQRRQCVTLRDPALGTAIIRDQKPLNETALAKCLTGMTAAEWRRLLNGRVFFWLSRKRLLRLLAGREYRASEHDVLELDTAAFVAAYRPRITLSAINSGATFALGAPARGPDTFRSIADFDFAGSCKPPGERVAELTVEGGVPDVAAFVTRLVRMRGSEETGTIFSRG